MVYDIIRQKSSISLFWTICTLFHMDAIGFVYFRSWHVICILNIKGCSMDVNSANLLNRLNGGDKGKYLRMRASGARALTIKAQGYVRQQPS